jgi:hypothetical protein
VKGEPAELGIEMARLNLQQAPNWRIHFKARTTYPRLKERSERAVEEMLDDTDSMNVMERTYDVDETAHHRRQCGDAEWR